MGERTSGARCAGRSEDFAGALAICRQLRAIFESTKGGAKDTDSLHRVRELCVKASRSFSDSVFRDRLGQLQNFADALFSDRKHQLWARNRTTSGVPSLRGRAQATLDAIERRLDSLGARRKVLQRPVRREGPVVAPLQTSSN